VDAFRQASHQRDDGARILVEHSDQTRFSTHDAGSTTVSCLTAKRRPRGRAAGFMLCNDRAAPARQSLG